MRVLRLLLGLLPAAFRAEYGDELLATAGEQWAERRHGLGAWGRAGFWLRQWRAALHTAVRLRLGQGVVGAADRAPREPWTLGLGKDVQHGLRALRARPGFSAVAILTLGLGVAAVTTTFSAVNAVLLRQLPYRDAGRIVAVRQTDTREGTLKVGVSAANIRDLHERARVLSDVGAATVFGFTLLENGRALSVRGWLVTEGFLEALGAAPVLGRTFRPEEFLPGRNKVVVLSHGTWQARFGGDPAIVGRTLVLDDAAHVVVGVLPAAFKYPGPSELWAPRAPEPWDADFRGGSGMHAVARLAPGATLAEAQAELDAMAAALSAAYPRTNGATGFRAVPLRQHLFGEVQSPLFILFGAGGLVLLIAAANVAGLQLARGTGRTREYALRGALGASAWRILRLVTIESVLVSGAGGVAGALLALFGADLIRLAEPGQLPRIEEVSIDGAVLAFALLTAVASGVLAGIAPALRASRTGLQTTLSEGARGSRGRLTTALRDRLVVAEIAVALVLTIGAGLLLQSFDRLLDNALGFDPARKLAVQVFAYTDADEPDLEFVRRSLDRIAALPGVETVGVTTTLPLADNRSIWSMTRQAKFAVDGHDAPVPGEEPTAWVAAIDGGYADAMGIGLRAGRTFGRQDHAGSAPVAMVNEAFARRYLSADRATGQVVRMGQEPREIVGVLADVRPAGFQSEPRPEIYIPFFQSPTTGGITFVMRTATDPATLLRAVQEELWAVDPGQATWAAKPMTDLVQDWLRQRRFYMLLLAAFAGLALFLAGIGVYALMSFSVTERIRELGIRRALGGHAGDIVGLILRRACVLGLAGSALGLAGAYGLTGLLRGQLVHIQPFDPVTFGALSVFVVLIVVLAACVPAVRAMKVDPVVALRAE